MSNWKIGQKLVCIDPSGFQCKEIDPKLGEIVTFDGLSPYGYGSIFLKEYTRYHIDARVAFMPFRFRPLQGEPAKAELLSSFREVVESPDCPINVPQTETV